MVHVPTRGDVPVRLGPGIPITPGYGPSAVSSRPYTRPRAVRARARAGAQHALAPRRALLGRRRHRRLAQLREPRRDRRRSPASPTARWPRFHNVCQHRGPTFVAEWKGCGAKRFTCPYHGWMYDTTGKVIGVPEKVDFDPGAPRDLRAPVVAVDEWGGWVWVNLAGPDARAVAAGLDRRRHHGRPRSLPDGGHGPARGARVGRARQLQGDRRRLQRDLPRHLAAQRRPGVDEVGEGRHVPLRQRPQLHVLRARASSTATSWPRTGTTTGTRSATTSCSRTRCSTATPSTSRCSTRSRSTSTAPASSAGSSSTRATTHDPEYADYRQRMLDHWEHLKVVVGEDIDDLRPARPDQALEPATSRTSCRRASSRSPTTTS